MVPDLDPGILEAFAAAVAVPVVLRSLARPRPARAASEPEQRLEALSARYASWELRLGLLAFLLAIPSAWLLWLGLRGLSALHAAALPAAEVAWVAHPDYWATPAILLALMLMLPLSSLAEVLALRERRDEYLAYQRLKYRMNLARVGHVLGAVMAVLAGALIFLGLDWSVRLGSDGLVVNRYFAVGEERHAFSDVRSIRTAPALVAPNGNQVARREWVVTFADGRTWSTNGLLSQPPEAEKRRLVERLSAIGGVPVTEVELFRMEDL